MPDYPLAPQSLVDFVLRHMQVEAVHGTLQRTESGYVLERRTLSTWNFIYATRGRPVWVFEDTGEQPLWPGTLVLVPPGLPHRGRSRTRRMTIGSLHVQARLPGGQDVFELLLPPRAQQVRPASALDRYLRGMMAEYDRLPEPQVMLTLAGWAQLIVLELLRDNLERSLLRHRSGDMLIADVLDELTRRMHEPVTLDELASFAGYSPQHLNRVFRRVLGVTPLRYLTRIRMERAAELLIDGRMTVRAIAQQVGIGDAYYFSRLFKQHTGQSPARYRETRETSG